MTKFVVNFYSLIGYEIAIFKNCFFFFCEGGGGGGEGGCRVEHLARKNHNKTEE